LILLMLASAALAANRKLYLKDGSHHVVREYQVNAGRVRFYSLERSDWEEIPLELVDLKRTEAEQSSKQARLEEEAKIISAEEKVERELEKEVMRIPLDPGAYRLEAEQLKIFKQAETKMRSNKRRSVLKAISPIPMIAGKATLELDLARSLNVIHDPNPEIYIQLSAEQRFGILKLTPNKGVRIVERLTIVPVSKEVIEERDMVEIYRKQLAGSLYKIWPAQPLDPGEYAVAEFTDGKLNIQLWDFSYQPK